MKERLRIHHAIGSKVLLDSFKDAVRFKHQYVENRGWIFKINSTDPSVFDGVLKFKDEVNVFIFKEKDNVAVEKIWFYMGDHKVNYDEAENSVGVPQIIKGHISGPLGKAKFF